MTQSPRQPAPDHHSDKDTTRTTSTRGSSDVETSLREDTNAYAFGATTMQPRGAGPERLPPGPGNEALEGGASPAPRGYTGSAMARFAAGLSPSFQDAARGEHGPGEEQL